MEHAARIDAFEHIVQGEVKLSKIFPISRTPTMLLSHFVPRMWWVFDPPPIRYRKFPLRPAVSSVHGPVPLHPESPAILAWLRPTRNNDQGWRIRE